MSINIEYVNGEQIKTHPSGLIEKVSVDALSDAIADLTNRRDRLTGFIMILEAEKQAASDSLF